LLAAAIRLASVSRSRAANSLDRSTSASSVVSSAMIAIIADEACFFSSDSLDPQRRYRVRARGAPGRQLTRRRLDSRK